jgi:hypothetical protein
MNQYGGNNECRLSNKIDTFKEQLEFRKISKLTIDQLHITNYNNWCAIILENIIKSFELSMVFEKVKDDKKQCNLFKFYSIKKNTFSAYLKEKKLEIIKEIEFTEELYNKYKNIKKKYGMFEPKNMNIKYYFPTIKDLYTNIDERENNFLCEDFIGILETYVEYAGDVNFYEDPNNNTIDLGPRYAVGLEKPIEEYLIYVKFFIDKFLRIIRSYYLDKSYHYYVVKEKESGNIHTLFVNGVFDNYDDQINPQMERISQIQNYVKKFKSINSLRELFKEILVDYKNNPSQKGGWGFNPLKYAKKKITSASYYVEKKVGDFTRDRINKNILNLTKDDIMHEKIAIILKRFFYICILKICPASKILNLRDNHSREYIFRKNKIIDLVKKVLFKKKEIFILIKNINHQYGTKFRLNDEIIINHEDDIIKILKQSGIDNPNDYYITPKETHTSTNIGIDYLICEIIKSTGHYFGKDDITVKIKKIHYTGEEPTDEKWKLVQRSIMGTGNDITIKLQKDMFLYFSNRKKIESLINNLSDIINFYDNKSDKLKKNYFDKLNFEIKSKIQNIDFSLKKMNKEINKLKKIQNNKVFYEIKNRENTVLKKKFERNKLLKELHKKDKQFNKKKDIINKILKILIKAKNLDETLMFYEKKIIKDDDDEIKNKLISLNQKISGFKNNESGGILGKIKSKIKIFKEDINNICDGEINDVINEINSVDSDKENNLYDIKAMDYSYIPEHFIYSYSCNSNFFQCNTVQYPKIKPKGKDKNEKIKGYNLIEQKKIEHFKKMNKLTNKQLKELLFLDLITNKLLNYNGVKCSTECKRGSYTIYDECDLNIIKEGNKYYAQSMNKNYLNEKIQYDSTQNKIEEIKNKIKNLKEEKSEVESKKEEKSEEVNDDKKEEELLAEMKKLREKLNSFNIKEYVKHEVFSPHDLELYHINDEVIYTDPLNKTEYIAEIININYPFPHNDLDIKKDIKLNKITFDLAVAVSESGNQLKEFELNKEYKKGDFVFHKSTDQFKSKKYVAKKNFEATKLPKDSVLEKLNEWDEIINNNSVEKKSQSLNSIKKTVYKLKFPCKSCHDTDHMFHFNVIEIYANLLAPKLKKYSEKIIDNNSEKQNYEEPLMFFNPITQNRFERGDIDMIQKIFMDALIELQTNPPPKNLLEKIKRQASLKNLNEFSKLIELGSAVNPALGSIRGISLLVRTIGSINKINRLYKNFSELYKLHVSDKDSSLSKDEKWMKTAAALIGLAASGKSMGLINYKEIDLLGGVIPAKLESALEIPFIGDEISDALHMDKVAFMRSTSSILKSTSSTIIKGYGILMTTFKEKKNIYYEHVFNKKINFSIYNTHKLNSEMFLDYQKNGGTLESVLFRINYLDQDFTDTTMQLENCDCDKNIPNFQIGDKYSLRAIQSSKILKMLHKSLGDSGDLLDKALHWYIDIVTTNKDTNSKCNFTLGYRYDKKVKRLKPGLSGTVLESPDYYNYKCNTDSNITVKEWDKDNKKKYKKGDKVFVKIENYKNNYIALKEMIPGEKYDRPDISIKNKKGEWKEETLYDIQKQTNCVIGEIYKDKNKKFFYKGKIVKDKNKKPITGELNLAQVQFLKWFIKPSEKKKDILKDKKDDNLYKKDLPFKFFWAFTPNIFKKKDKWYDDEYQSSESFVKLFHNKPEIIIRNVYKYDYGIDYDTVKDKNENESTTTENKNNEAKIESTTTEGKNNDTVEDKIKNTTVINKDTKQAAGNIEKYKKSRKRSPSKKSRKRAPSKKSRKRVSRKRSNRK